MSRIHPWDFSLPIHGCQAFRRINASFPSNYKMRVSFSLHGPTSTIRRALDLLIDDRRIFYYALVIRWRTAQPVHILEFLSVYQDPLDIEYALDCFFGTSSKNWLTECPRNVSTEWRWILAWLRNYYSHLHVPRNWSMYENFWTTFRDPWRITWVLPIVGYSIA